MDELAYAATMNGDLRRAAQLLGAGHAVAQTTGQNPTERRRYWHGLTSLQDSIRGTLGEAAFTLAFEQGRRMDQHDAVHYALRTHRDIEKSTPTPACPASPTSPLTPRELQVAELIAQGLSNHQIATRLVISHRTAESHVENILRKQGFSSRTQVATWITQHTESE